MMILHEFITSYRDPIIARAREKLTDRPWAVVSQSELEYGVPLFLTQLSETLRLETTATPFANTAIGESAARHGRELRTLGFNVSQVVHDYGDICQAITEVAVEHNLPITTEEFHTLNRCLDTAIAGAVTEHARVTAETRTTEEIERIGQLAHELRDVLHSAVLAFNTLKLGAVAINGSTGAVLGRSLMNLRDLVDNTLADVRMDANIQRRERILVAALLSEIAVVSNLHADVRGLRFAVEHVDPGLVVNGDPQLLESAITNLLNNAFKFTNAGGLIMLRAVRDGESVRIEVEDECGGLAEGVEVVFKPFAGRRKADRSGLGLGLSIARKAVVAHGGDIHFRNVPGTGCVFSIGLPLAAESLAAPELFSTTPSGRLLDMRFLKGAGS
jgi:signal transduction histidine kinase